MITATNYGLHKDRETSSGVLSSFSMCPVELCCCCCSYPTARLSFNIRSQPAAAHLHRSPNTLHNMISISILDEKNLHSFPLMSTLEWSGVAFRKTRLAPRKFDHPDLLAERRLRVQRDGMGLQPSGEMRIASRMLADARLAGFNQTTSMGIEEKYCAVGVSATTYAVDYGVFNLVLVDTYMIPPIVVISSTLARSSSRWPRNILTR